MMKSDEYIVELGKALYDPDTGAAVFKPEFRERITRCRDCKFYDTSSPYGTVVPDAYHCKANDRFYGKSHYCGYGERRE